MILTLGFSMTVTTEDQKELEQIVDRMNDLAELTNSDISVIYNNRVDINGFYAAIIELDASEQMMSNFAEMLFDQPVETLRGEKDELDSE